MKILIIGGTRFVGRALVDAALEHNHELTLFNRGQSNPDIYPDIERITGDRDGGLDALGDRRWDAVIDTCGYVPRVVKASADYLADKVDHYTFISTLSVYDMTPDPDKDENAPLATMDDETVEEINGETYGPLKVLCEQAIEAAMPGRVFIPRPGLIVGPHDPTNRFTYWPVRIASGGDVLAGGSPDSPVQFIDVRDLGEWTIRMVEAGKTGAYNTNGPGEPLTFGEWFQTCREVSGSDANIVWCDNDFLLEQEVGPFMELPLWLPDQDQIDGFYTFNVEKAKADGLTYRPLAETVRATLDWFNNLEGEQQWQAGLDPEKEARILEAWRNRPD